MGGYTPEDKTAAVGIIERYGGLTDAAIEAVRIALDAPGLSKSTIHGWRKAAAKPQPQPAEPKKEPPNRTEPIEPNQSNLSQTPDEALELDMLFEKVARRYLNHAQRADVVVDTKGKDAVIAAATAVDKMRLLRNLPTEIIGILPAVQELYELIAAQGQDPATVFNRMIAKLHAQRIDTDGR